MTDTSRPSNPLTLPGGDQNGQYSRGILDDAGQMSQLFRVTTVLHGLTDLGAITSALLTTLITEEGLGFDRAALFVMDRTRRRLRGFDAAGERERELTRDFWKLLDGFPESIADSVRLIMDPRRRLCSPLGRKVRRLVCEMGETGTAMALAVSEGRPVCTAVDGVPDPEGLVRALGPGPWSFWPLPGIGGVSGVVAVAGGYAQPLPGQIRELLNIVSHHAGLSIERGMTYQELERQVAEMATIQEVSRGILSATNLQDLLLLISRVAARVMQARWGVTWLAEGPEETLRVASQCGLAPADNDFLEALTPLAARCVETHRPVRRTEVGSDGIPAPASEGTVRSIVFVPLIAFGRTMGVLGVGDREASGDLDHSVFEEEDEQFLTVLGTQAAIAIKNANLFEQVRIAEKRLRETQSLLMQTEKLAALGEMSAKVAHEIRNPLTSVGGFARRIARAMPEGDPNRESAELIIRETRRLEGILSEQLEFARLSRPRLEDVDLCEVVGDTIHLIREEADRKGVAILEEYGRNLPPVLLDRDKVRQVFLNILHNALEAVSQGNRIQIRVDRVGGDIRLEIGNDGEPLPGEIMDSLFVPFATARAGGTGLGLAVAHQIVKEHGGEIQVRTGDEWSAIFTVSFPIRDNLDRRRTLPDRRAGRDRRRAA